MTVYVVEMLVQPGKSNPDAKQFSQLPLKTSHLYTNKKRQYFYGFKIFTDKNVAIRAQKLYMKKFNDYSENDPWVIIGGTDQIREFDNEKKALERERKVCKKFYRYKIF